MHRRNIAFPVEHVTMVTRVGATRPSRALRRFLPHLRRAFFGPVRVARLYHPVSSEPATYRHDASG